MTSHSISTLFLLHLLNTSVLFHFQRKEMFILLGSLGRMIWMVNPEDKVERKEIRLDFKPLHFY